jgi:hypothetical protein
MPLYFPRFSVRTNTCNVDTNLAENGNAISQHRYPRERGSLVEYLVYFPRPYNALPSFPIYSHANLQYEPSVISLRRYNGSCPRLLLQTQVQTSHSFTAGSQVMAYYWEHSIHTTGQGMVYFHPVGQTIW